MKPVTTALVISGALALYLAIGILSGPRHEQAVEAAAGDKAFPVVYQSFTARDFGHEASVRGHTEALRKVALKAEIDGRVIATPVEKGTRIKKGDVICRIDTADRAASLAEAKALLDQRQLEYNVAVSLAAKGHRSETQTAAAKAQLDAALAAVDRRQLDLAYTAIKAPFDGIVETREAEVGTYLQKGSICATLMLEEPFLAVAEASEAFVGDLDVGEPATVSVKGLPDMTGRIRYVASAANLQTRGFRVEVELANPEHTLKEGLTATIRLPIGRANAHLLSPSWFILDKEGRLGVRLVDAEDRAAFMPVQVLDDAEGGVWVAGLPDEIRIITTGQDFVADGEKVRLVEEGAPS
ncbi:efflux RND transporter periplasmic adaptor subunit [Pseudokordiimonas caeni]|uniref:efflux RND transporter periplasmic adaptor subunit n=1 Tax=Pseudokordiimonas caeni TaxID=2997908 RepID=UPI0028121A45|nr:efflux RND transporter periplasmic adaptor subunit [Pseudokordiimonas caeni]